MSGKPIQMDLCGVDCDIQPWHVVVVVIALIFVAVAVYKAGE